MVNLKSKALIIGLSGASSSGKTTLGRLLRDIFPNTFLLHEDDFYKPEAELPMKDGLLDWDCAEALSLPDMARSLEYIKANGALLPDFDSKEDRNAVGHCPVTGDAIQTLKSRVNKWTQLGNPGYGILSSSASPLRLCILDGFLLYSPSMASIQPQIDIKFFLRVSYAKAKARREARNGYATIEGWWQDPPGYVDKIVWPNYVADHNWMFENGNVEGKFKDGVLVDWEIECQAEKDVDVDMETTLNWIAETLMKKIEEIAVNS